MSDKPKWTSEAGPIQTKKVSKALSAIGTEANYKTEVTGVHDGRTAAEVVAAFTGRKADGTSYDFSVMSYWQFNIGGTSDSTQAAKASALYAALGERFGWLITRANYQEVIAGAAEAVADLHKTRPIIDKRVTPEEDAESKALSVKRNDEAHAANAKREAATAAIRAKAPAGAAAMIVARYNEDTSHGMSDYSGHDTVAEYVIGWRYGKREDFKQLRAAAEAFLSIPRKDAVETCPGGSDKHPCRHRGGMYGDQAPFYEGEGPHPIYAVVNGDEYAKVTEHRDNYSMGGGNYLSDHGWGQSGTGWVIRSIEGWNPSDYIDAIPASSNLGSKVASDLGSKDFAVRPSQQRDGYVEVTFPAKPTEDVRSELKSAGFRWALRSACWYGPASALPSRYAQAVA